ncbi:MAG: ATP-binding cassette domain-containing protein [Faecalibacterium sp.]|nr:ATP-binding cassette domain-containing protein [Ruminococcus sp.]MCM1392024.1 ATP-binding cassette domain-containing protein [Ruminococcus sp.]MCM1484831.1 ATP-binding cassette domain-containing protein [Faecalibacterium sp.]
MIKINNLTFGYNSEKTIIHDFSAEFKSGERVCISAPSGKGKTTLFRLMTGLENAQTGSIEFKENIKIGMVFQNDVLLPWQTAKENVMNVCDEKSAKNWLSTFGLGDKYDAYPDEMSGGMCRRVALARAVGYEPDVLILDEAFKGLDKVLKESIMNLLSEHFEDRLIIFSSHEEVEINAFATRVINL